MQWWRQAVLDLAGVRETAAEAEEEGLEEYRRGVKTEDSRIWDNSNGYKVAQ